MAPPAKVTPDLRRKAAKMQAAGSSLAEIAEVTGISKARWGQLLPRVPEPGAPVSAAASAATQKLVPVVRRGKVARVDAPLLPAPVASPTPARSSLLAAIATVLDADPALAAALPIDPVDLARALLAATVVDGPIDLDPLAMLGRAARGLEKDLARLDATQVAARRSVWQALTAVARIMEGIRLGRPTEDSPDEAVARIVAIRDAAIDRIGVLTSDAAAKLAQDRAAFAADVLAGKLAPVDVVARVDAMLSGAAA